MTHLPATLVHTIIGRAVARRRCSSSTGCGTGEVCLDAFGAQALPYTRQSGGSTGVCYGTCALFGSSCGTGFECGPIPLLGSTTYASGCHQVGHGSEGDSCTGFGSCISGLACVPDGCAFTCRALCDTGHNCPSGRSCDTASLGLAGGAGVCR